MKCGHLFKKKSLDDLKQGDIWIWSCFEAQSKLWLDYRLGKRSYDNAEKLIDSVLQLLAAAPLLITADAYAAYEKPLLNTFDVPFVQIVKHRDKGKVTEITHNLLEDDKFSEAVKAITNSEVSKIFNTSFIERFNSTLRQCNSRCRRKSYTFSKDIEMLECSLDLFQAYYNLVRLHGKEQKSTPAMKANLLDKPLTIRELLTYRF